MDGKYVLDSNIVIDYFDGDSKVVNKIREKPKIFLPIIVIGELYLGAILSKKLVSRDEHFQYVENLKWIKW
ncbi:MAG: hypothetical protein IIA88_05890 [Bacteroidetes bacterium]|nr:hypothetical protein [Bacteroidota bacterium]